MGGGAIVLNRNGTRTLIVPPGAETMGVVGEFLVGVGGFEKPRGVCVSNPEKISRYAVLFWRAGHI